MSINAQVQQYLSDRPHAIGETVQFGWFIFRIVEVGRPSRIETLDFRKMASFTEDFTVVERIHALQTAALAEFNVSECPCSLRQYAQVSVSYSPERNDAFMERLRPTDGNDSGWYIGVCNDPCDMNNPSSFTLQSLYELTIHDSRMTPYWLLPSGIVISLSGKAITEQEVSCLK